MGQGELRPIRDGAGPRVMTIWECFEQLQSIAKALIVLVVIKSAYRLKRRSNSMQNRTRQSPSGSCLIQCYLGLEEQTEHGEK